MTPGLKIACKKRIAALKRKLKRAYATSDGSFEYVIVLIPDLYEQIGILQNQLNRWNERTDRWAA